MYFFLHQLPQQQPAPPQASNDDAAEMSRVIAEAVMNYKLMKAQQQVQSITPRFLGLW